MLHELVPPRAAVLPLPAEGRSLMPHEEEGTGVMEGLRDFGFAPGDYLCWCGRCQGVFHGDKRAIRCKTCAQLASSIRRAGERNPMGIMNWLMDHVFDREGAREWRETCAEFDHLSAQTEAICRYVEKTVDVEGVRDRHPHLAAMYPDMFERKYFHADGTPILRRASHGDTRK